MPHTPAGGPPATDPYAELRKLLTIDQAQALVDGLFLLRQYWQGRQGFGSVTLDFEPSKAIARVTAERASK